MNPKAAVKTGQPYLQSKIKAFKGVTEMEIIGGNCCVVSNALDAVKAGYAVVFPCEYIGIRNKERFIKKLEQLRDAGVNVIYEYTHPLKFAQY